ncbi:MULTISPECIES: hypothetical protein [unclassified Methanosarcina]|nr:MULTISPECIES: hypothetical protein [unclassified Methanosarcina]
MSKLTFWTGIATPASTAGKIKGFLAALPSYRFQIKPGNRYRKT